MPQTVNYHFFCSFLAIRTHIDIDILAIDCSYFDNIVYIYNRNLLTQVLASPCWGASVINRFQFISSGKLIVFYGKKSN